MYKQQQSVSSSLQKCEGRYLILVFGLPASGKSTYSHYLKQHIFPQALLISGDNIQLILQQQPNYIQYLTALNSQQLMHQLRKIQNNKVSISKKPLFNPQNWKESRKFIQQAVDKIIKFCSVIIDDDFLLRSQRKVYRKISWSHQIKYLELHMDSSVEQCLQNLKTRNVRNDDCIITEEIVLKASQKLEIIQDSQYYLGINTKNKEKITRQYLINKMKVVQIQPNDPNDPQYYIQKPKHEHTSQEIIQMQVRGFVNSAMKLNEEDLSQKLGQALVKEKGLNNKKTLAHIMNEWKKMYTKAKDRSSNHIQMQNNFKQYLMEKLE